MSTLISDATEQILVEQGFGHREADDYARHLIERNQRQRKLDRLDRQAREWPMADQE